MSYGIEDYFKLHNTYVQLKGLLNANEATRRAQDEEIAQLRKECGKLNDEVFELRLKCCQELKHDEENLHLREENRKLRVAAENALQDHAQADTDTLRALHERNQLREENAMLTKLVQDYKLSLPDIELWKNLREENERLKNELSTANKLAIGGEMRVRRLEIALQEASDGMHNAVQLNKQYAEAKRELREALEKMVSANDGFIVMQTTKAHQQNEALKIARETLAKTKP